MAPSAKALEKALANAVRELWDSPQRDQLSVTLARKHAEKSLDLETDFFLQGDWKAQSKSIIRDLVVRTIITHRCAYIVGSTF